MFTVSIRKMQISKLSHGILSDYVLVSCAILYVRTEKHIIEAVHLLCQPVLHLINGHEKDLS